MAPLIRRASKASKFRSTLGEMGGAVALGVTSASSNSMSMVPELGPEVWEVFRNERSSCTEELPENEEVSELLHSREVPASDGKSLMNFSGRKRESDLGFPEYREPQPFAGSLPDKRSLAFRALEREVSM